MDEFKVHTGGTGERLKVTFLWFNENNVQIETVAEVRILNRDKPRTMEFAVNGVVVATVLGSDYPVGGR